MANNADNNLTKSDIVNALHKKLTEDKGIKATKDLCNRIVTTLFDGESGLIADWLSAKAESNAIIKVKKNRQQWPVSTYERWKSTPRDHTWFRNFRCYTS